jgi:hypothetical protein
MQGKRKGMVFHACNSIRLASAAVLPASGGIG